MKDIVQIEEMAMSMRRKALEMAFDCGKNGSHLGVVYLPSRYSHLCMVVS